MIKKIFKPFWSYDVERTEEWLSDMATKGYRFVKIDTLSRRFVFEKGGPKQITYRIVREKKNEIALPQSLLGDGWQHVQTDRNWHVIANECQVDQINTFPNREGILKHNRVVMYIFTGVLIYLSFSLLLSLTLLMSSFVRKEPIETVPSPFWILTPFIGLTIIGMWVLSIYSTMKLYRNNQQLSGEWSIQGLERRRKFGEIGGMITRRKWFWFDAPDKLEKWLEEMELQGYHLRSVGKRGFSFFFKKGMPRYMKYCVDHQNSTKRSYFEMHREAGWEPVFTSGPWQAKWTIWAFEYSGSGIQPQLYTERSDQLKHTRRVVTNNILYALPMFFVIYLMLTMDDFFSMNMSLFRWSMLVLYILGIGFSILRIVRTILYYVRNKGGQSFSIR